MEPMVSSPPLFSTSSMAQKNGTFYLFFLPLLNEIVIAAEAMLEELAFKLGLCEDEE